MSYPELKPEVANFCSMCRKPLDELEIEGYRLENMPPLCYNHLHEVLPKRAECLKLFSKMNLS
jgi:hypothetical protein